MHRLLVALLAALDAVLAAAGGIAVVLAPLTLLWVFGIGNPDWSALWPASAAVWHLGHLVPVTLTLPDTYLAATGIDPSFATFTLSLAPLAFAAFTALFAARSGARAGEAGAALTGWLSGSVVFTALTTVVALTSNAALVASDTWLSILLPSLFFVAPSFIGAVLGAWRVGDDGPVDAVRGWIARMPRDWALVPALAIRGFAVTALGLVAVASVVVVVGLIARSTQVIGLFQASNADALGATVIALGQLMYLPTLVLWALSFTAGPGFALGTDTAVTPAATQVGALPGIPVLGAVPDTTSSWLLLLVLLPVAVGALTGWILRSRMPLNDDHEPVAPRLVVALSVAVLTGGAGALAAVLSSGAIGPGRLVETGPQPGPLALALGLEVLVGLAIMLLGPRVGGDAPPEVVEHRDETPAFVPAPRAHTAFDHDEHATGPAPVLAAPGTGIASDVWPRTFTEPDAARPSATPVATPERTEVGLTDEERARIRAAWGSADRDGHRDDR
ncbi:DUF6350 family protein [Microbacterium sp. KSW2-21]|uniref:DUF6350 family protein n=1 Tax=Microbacterium algihabitans TaxID=3075992 RepID=A0ABU3RRM3_9MICO|nr:DUF6350 family protein [Microbacterium sp. KSW2-21]MDU0325552.1 DUF6350 family protein [Microbacterium sp. KSW2-21]